MTKPTDVRALTVSPELALLQSAGLDGFEEEIAYLLEEGSMTEERAGELLAWAAMFTRQQQATAPQATAQREWRQRAEKAKRSQRNREVTRKAKTAERKARLVAAVSATPGGRAHLEILAIEKQLATLRARLAEIETA